MGRRWGNITIRGHYQGSIKYYYYTNCVSRETRITLFFIYINPILIHYPFNPRGRGSKVEAKAFGPEHMGNWACSVQVCSLQFSTMGRGNDKL
jgi:hypothetical protein